MKIKDGFILREVADTYIVVAVGEQSAHFNKIIKLNTTAAFLWNLLKEEQTAEALAEKLAEEYEIDLSKAEADTLSFIETLKAADLLV